MTQTQVQNLPPVVSHDEWLQARKQLLEKEKALMKAHDRLNAERRQLPMVKVEKSYSFAGPKGRVRLLDLFEGRRQLIVHHFMLRDGFCTSCASTADTVGGLRQLHARDTTLVAVSWAPHEKLAATAKQMGWTFPWYSCADSDFNYDFHATVDDRKAPVLVGLRDEKELAEVQRPWDSNRNGAQIPTVSCFYRDGGDIYYTYATFDRGTEPFIANYPYLDLTVLGRQEAWEEPKGRAEDKGRRMGGPNLMTPDQYEDL